MRRLPGRLPPLQARPRECLVRTVSLTALRRIAIEAQGYATRSRAGSAAEVEAAIRRLSCVQLDSISAVERSHRIALASRVGAYKPGIVPRLLARAASSSTGRTRHACSLSRSGRCSWPRCETGAGGGTGTSARPIRTSRTRSWPRSGSAARSARATSREQRGRRDVELEAGEGDARPPLEPRRPRDRGPAGVPAPLRPAGAGDSEGDPGRPGAERRGAPPGPGARRPSRRAAR